MNMRLSPDDSVSCPCRRNRFRSVGAETAKVPRLRKQSRCRPATEEGSWSLLPKPRFTLTDTSGAPFDFWSNTQGVVTLLFFGYTSCRTSVRFMSRTSGWGWTSCPRQHEPGCRWSLSRLTRTGIPLNSFAHGSIADKRFIGLTGSEAEVEAAQQRPGCQRQEGRARGRSVLGRSCELRACVHQGQSRARDLSRRRGAAGLGTRPASAPERNLVEPLNTLDPGLLSEELAG